MIFNSRSREPKSPFRSPLVYRSFLSMTHWPSAAQVVTVTVIVWKVFLLCKFQPFTDDNPLIFASFQMAVKQLCISIFSQFNPWYMLSIRTSEIPLIYFNQDDIMLVKTFMICLLLTELMVLLWCQDGDVESESTLWSLYCCLLGGFQSLLGRSQLHSLNICNESILRPNLKQNISGSAVCNILRIYNTLHGNS